MMTVDNGTVLVEDEEEANCVDQVANQHKHNPEQGLALHLAIGKGFSTVNFHIWHHIL